ncbi:FAD-binding oxidoreductase [Permianibacter sp. IMCC34836]|uniref:D-2-hydroxyglutarate dehydrogenase YdiJ n=1 Tax=Permianibacter fluminis TaxID=2738515 RepID=UPI001553DB28|nr:FAD-binding and (Fe-S)-binding domain-containing protein [Permianibacter fluminis]NQD37811.1 FAD-binding oxidoreductase [Permianibacter fluminis]
MTVAVPVLQENPVLEPVYRAYVEALNASGFAGIIATDYATRLVHATDNSVYQLLPQAVLFPRDEADVSKIFQLADKAEFHSVQFAPRGGGTGTNGQSLTTGIVIDVSRFQNRILELNVNEGWVRVQPGVILDQLQDLLNPQGFFFAPELSPSNRATLGGMANTDACGKGSRLYGRTGDHVLALRVVLNNGDVLDSARLEANDFFARKHQPGREGEIYRLVDEACRHAPVHPGASRLGRFITAYNLWHVVNEKTGSFSLNPLLCGSEGTLALVTELKLKITPLPSQKALFAIRYKSFDAALAAAQDLLKHQPSAIETVDDKILTLAKDDIIFPKVKPYLGDNQDFSGNAINLVEFVGDNASEFASRAEQLKAELPSAPGVISFHFTTDKAAQAALWDLRKKGVGLLGNAKGKRRPIPFVEDTAVPPENLAAYIREFRELLDGHGLSYGMFGHVDVGCLHVRPALNLRTEDDEATFRKISDAVYALVKKYGGVMWSEHGKGFRSWYGPEFHGEDIYRRMRQVKTAFDPRNQFNPGKICAPLKHENTLYEPFKQTRGELDRQISVSAETDAPGALYCNGNGQCFDYRMDSVMCPSYKATGDRRHSPKGRSGLMREWLRQASNAGVQLQPVSLSAAEKLKREWRRLPLLKTADDFSHQVNEAMSGCLGCKACNSQCPIKVDVPSQKSLFLHHYHRRYPRPLRDYLLTSMESWAPIAGVVPHISNVLLLNPLSRLLARWTMRLQALPRFASRNVYDLLRARKARRFNAKELSRLSPDQRSHTVLLLQDAFTSFFDTDALASAVRLLERLGKRVVILPFQPLGKAEHVKGRLPEFIQRAQAAVKQMRELAELKLPVISVESTQALLFRQEYPMHVDCSGIAKVQTLAEYLASVDDALPVKRQPIVHLFSHCTEKTQLAESAGQWQRIFKRFGVELRPVNTGCCGMAGSYGHEREHDQESRLLFEQSWSDSLSQARGKGLVCATGFSCREQTHRLGAERVPDPATILLALLS